MDPYFERRLIELQNATKTPTKNSPHKSPMADRFIPIRNKAVWKINFDTTTTITTETTNTPTKTEPHNTNDNLTMNDENIENSTTNLYKKILKSELLDPEDESPLKMSKNIFQYQLKDSPHSSTSSFSLSPIKNTSHQILSSPGKTERKVPRAPYKVLDAPELQDDFYLNLLDWSSNNLLAVALSSCLYMWNAGSAQVTKLCDLSGEDDSVTSVSWNDKQGNLLSIGSSNGSIQLWDVTAQKRLYKTTNHTARVGSLAWKDDVLAAGSRDRSISLVDARQHKFISLLTSHKQEVCGLKWSPDGGYLASGGNDNQLLLWNMQHTQPVHSFAGHLAAVKAIAWSPHQHGVLASGGGTADRRIRFWNTLTLRSIRAVHTSSQVCNLAWSQHSNELVSTHGYSENNIVLWRLPSMKPLAKLSGHSMRVLFLATSPDGQSIVTGAGDETLRFWNVFCNTPCRKDLNSALSLFSKIR